MAGQPRRRIAARLALHMTIVVRRGGPMHIDALLETLGYGPSHWEHMSRRERAATRMAIGRVQTIHGARIDADGMVSLPSRERAA